jgi:hypothetical protein
MPVWRVYYEEIISPCYLSNKILRSCSKILYSGRLEEAGRDLKHSKQNYPRIQNNLMHLYAVNYL